MSAISIPEEHKVRLEVFEGPLDLLLYLIKKEEVDIYDIPIVKISDQYMEYLNVMRMLDLNIAGEFLVMAATLMLIKSRLLLPPEDRPAVEEEEEDPRWELIRQLVEYRKFKEAAVFLQGKEIQQENMFALGSHSVELGPDPGLRIEDVSIFDLIATFNSILKELPTEDLSTLFTASYNVPDKIESILGALAGKEAVPFSALFSHMTHRQEIVCTFLAVLELIRLRQIKASQDTLFGEIVIMGIKE
ncbi:MAG: segregation/condensation protein A [bacterium]